jgi:Tol biopolymer transport system component
MALRIRNATIGSISADTGTSSTDFITDDTTLTLSGTVTTTGSEGTATLDIFLVGGAFGTGNGTLVGAVAISAGGAWTFNLTTSSVVAAQNLANGTYRIRLAAASAPSTTLASRTLVVDTTAPSAPSTPNLIAASDTGSSTTDNITNVTTPTFSGTAVASSTVTIFSDGVAVGSGVATAGGNYSITTSALAQGTRSITAKATDIAGNVSLASAALSVTIDTAAPAPSAPDLTAASDDGISSTDNITSRTTPTFAGTAEANSTVTLFDGTTPVGSAAADGLGNWSITASTLTEGAHSITATATDIAGNVSLALAALPVTIVAPTTTVTNGLIAFPDKDSGGNVNLFLINQSGTGRTQLTTGTGSNVQPWWAPDGNSLIYEKVTGNSILVGDIYTINSNGTGVQLIASNAVTPAWSPLGTSITYSRATSSTQVEIWTMSPSGTNQVQLTHLPSPFVGISPTYSPDGTSILYARVAASGSTNSALWIMNSDGTNDHQLTSGTWNNLDANGNILNTANAANDAAWGPDNTIAFWAGVENQYGQIWTIKPDGTERKQLTHVAVGLSADEPAWAPDGTQLLFTSNMTQIAGTWVMNSDGAGQRFLTPNAAGSTPSVPGDAAWQPVLQTTPATGSPSLSAALTSPSSTLLASATTPSTSIAVSYTQADLTALFQDVMGRAPGTAELVGMQDTVVATSLSSLRDALSIMGSEAACALSAAPLGDAVLTATVSPDLFVFGDIAFGNDTIVGFDPARDTVRLSHSRVADLDALRNATIDVGGGTLIALGNGQSITIGGVASSSLGLGNLIIV